MPILTHLILSIVVLTNSMITTLNKNSNKKNNEKNYWKKVNALFKLLQAALIIITVLPQEPLYVINLTLEKEEILLKLKTL